MLLDVVLGDMGGSSASANPRNQSGMDSVSRATELNQR